MKKSFALIFLGLLLFTLSACQQEEKIADRDLFKPELDTESELLETSEDNSEAQAILAEEIAKSENLAEIYTYTNEEFGIEFEYPANWEPRLASDSLVYLENLESRDQTISFEKIQKTELEDLGNDWFLASDYPMASREGQTHLVDSYKALILNDSHTIVVNKATEYLLIQNGIGMERDIINNDVYMGIVDSIVFMD